MFSSLLGSGGSTVSKAIVEHDGTYKYAKIYVDGPCLDKRAKFQGKKSYDELNVTNPEVIGKFITMRYKLSTGNKAAMTKYTSGLRIKT